MLEFIFACQSYRTELYILIISKRVCAYLLHMRITRCWLNVLMSVNVLAVTPLKNYDEVIVVTPE